MTTEILSKQPVELQSDGGSCAPSADSTRLAAAILEQLRMQWQGLDLAGTGAADVLDRSKTAAVEVDEPVGVTCELREQAYAAYREAWESFQLLKELVGTAQRDLDVHTRVVGFVDAWTTRVREQRMA